MMRRLTYHSLKHRRINHVVQTFGCDDLRPSVGPWVPEHAWDEDQVIAQEITGESKLIMYKAAHKWTNLAGVKNPRNSILVRER